MPSFDVRPKDIQDTTEVLLHAAKRRVRTALPGVIRSFDPESVTCEVDIGIKPSFYSDDAQGNEVKSSKQYPILVDVPVIFPRGGGCSLTFPLREGDECLVMFSNRNLDFWWQSGGVQELASERVMDLSDSFVIPGPQSQTNTIPAISTSGAQLRTDDGQSFIEVAAGGDVTVTTQGTATVNAPEIVLNGNVTINGTLSQGMGESGGGATMLGPVTVTNDVTAGGKSVTGHTHGGVETGSGSTGKPE